MANILLFDLETLGPAPTGIVASAAFLAADLDIDYTFDELLSLVTTIKFNSKEQLSMGRITSADTLAWWKRQSPAAQSILKPSKEDVSLEVGLRRVAKYCKDNGITRESFGFCRGQSFDFPLIVDLFESLDMQSMWPIAFWRQRDIRTYISAIIGKHSMDKIALPKSVFNELHFVAHNAAHDIAKDFLMMQYAMRYVTGEASPDA